MTQNFKYRDVEYDITVITETMRVLGGVVQHSRKITVGVNGRYDGFFDSGCPANADLEAKINQVKEKVERWIDSRYAGNLPIPS